MPIPITRIAEHLEGELEGDESLRLIGFAEIDEASAEHLCFAKTESYLPALEASSAGAVIVSKQFPSIDGKTLIRVDDPGLAFIQAMEMFSPDRSFSGIHESAVIDPSARLGEDVDIGPNVVIEEGARVGTRVRIRAGAFIGAGVTIGDDCDIGPNVSVLQDCKIGRNCLLHPGVCIGADGYSFQWLNDHHHKIPQLGIVVVGDNVEIGANACIDRATMSETRIGEGTKIDNLVHIGHNNNVGKHVIMTALVGIAGSCKIGDGAIFGGQAGVIDHVEIEQAAMVGAKSLVTKNIAADSKVWGIPARPMEKTKRQLADLARVHNLTRQLSEQRQELQELKLRLAELENK